MSENKDWTEVVPEFLDLPIGETTFQIVGEPYIQSGKYGDRLFVPTNLGTWRLSILSPIARELKKWRKRLNHLSGCTLTVVRTGKDKDTRYSLKQLTPPQREHPVETPPPGQAMLPVTNEQFKQHLEALGIQPEAFNQLDKEEQAQLLRKLSMQQ